MKKCNSCGIHDREVKAKCRECYNEYMKEYVRKRYHRLRVEWIALLGGKCVSCGSIEDLNFDHRDPEEKEYDIAKILSTHSKAKVEKEMAKCQLLCEFCHIVKSVREGDIYSVPHGGGLTGKKNCRCDLCRPLKNEYVRQFKLSKRH